MRPVTHTASLEFAVGAPWEIYSFQGNDRVIDLYTKAGDLGAYSSMVALSPDHGVGITILAAGEVTTTLVAALTDMVGQTLIPALELAAKEEASRAFSGTYGIESAKSNSSLVISTDDDSGLKVSEWINNSVNMLEVVSGITSFPDLSIRLYPTGLRSQGSSSATKVSFRAVFGSLSSSSSSSSSQDGIGPVTRSSSSWELVDRYEYGNVGVDEFLFELDPKTGEAISISPRSLRETLPKMKTY
jgi:hypothetical protein